VSDAIDQAQGFEAFRRDLAVRSVRAEAEQLAAPAGFGLCNGCGAPIEPRRLRVVPGAQRCIGCQTTAESRRPVQTR